MVGLSPREEVAVFLLVGQFNCGMALPLARMVVVVVLSIQAIVVAAMMETMPTLLVQVAYQVQKR